MKISFLLEMLLNHWVNGNKNIFFLGISTFEEGILYYLKTLGFNYPLIHHHMAEEWNRQLHCCMNRKIHNPAQYTHNITVGSISYVR